MFTGLVTAVGRVRRATPRDGGVDLTITAPYRGMRLGESVAVNGACLTVTARGSGWLRVHAVTTTLDRTLFETYAAGRRVNLERPLRANDRLGGHFVQGHVDGIATVLDTREHDDALLIDLELPERIAKLALPQGSIAIDGVSMTITELRAPHAIRVSVIPWTRRHTTLGELVAGDEVHVEGDVLGKYVERLLPCDSTP
jgi:riboflavin synthase